MKFSYYTLKKYLTRKTSQFINELSQDEVLPGCKFTTDQLSILERTYDQAVNLAIKRLTKDGPSFLDESLNDLVERYCDGCCLSSDKCDMDCNIYQAVKLMDNDFETISYYELENTLYDKICPSCPEGPYSCCNSNCPTVAFLEYIRSALLDCGCVS